MLRAKLPSGDSKLIQIVDAALSESVSRSGRWLACKPGCAQCCMGVFGISQLDALRLQEGLAELSRNDPARAERVRMRAEEAAARLAPSFPGDPVTGLVDQSREAYERWNDFGNDEPCAALDPETKTCDLYEYRPMTCRTFGPPIMSDGELGVCELCYDGVSDDDIKKCEMRADSGDLEDELVKAAETATGKRGETIVLFALL